MEGCCFLLATRFPGPYSGCWKGMYFKSPPCQQKAAAERGCALKYRKLAESACYFLLVLCPEKKGSSKTKVALTSQQKAAAERGCALKYRKLAESACYFLLVLCPEKKGSSKTKVALTSQQEVAGVPHVGRIGYRPSW